MALLGLRALCIATLAIGIANIVFSKPEDGLMYMGLGIIILWTTEQRWRALLAAGLFIFLFGFVLFLLKIGHVAALIVLVTLVPAAIDIVRKGGRSGGAK